ncbi:coiled-coil domain-containing protein 33 [Ornithorhynchus anatinus]|uniref:coiled-coil domain-containing protein 33 n=1 Tax=Ornithorhynchus anatinus TaxID=9258 RepID=UPI0010A7E5AF|nr:coiled-coil domain-containing protein 33 [Ornithorhynchus anatinus]
MADDVLGLRKLVAALEEWPWPPEPPIQEAGLLREQKLAGGALHLKELSAKVQQLQNELIRKNDREKDLLMLGQAQQQQQAVLNKYWETLAKMKGLEETVRRQERVIEKMEMVLEEKIQELVRARAQLAPDSGPVGEISPKDCYSSLSAGHSQPLRDLDGLWHRSSPTISQQPTLPDLLSKTSEKLSLLAQLERAQSRIQALESQLEDSARQWGREKQDTATRLLEQAHGFSP